MKIILILFISILQIHSEAKKDIMYYFKILTKESSKEIIKNSGEPKNEAYKFSVKDIKNGFLQYDTLGMEGFSEFAIWIKKNGEVIAAQINYGCGPACSLASVKFYEFKKDNSYTEVTEKYYPEKKLTELYKKRLAKIEAKGASGAETYWVKIPRKGTTIIVGINQDHDLPGEKLAIFSNLNWNGNGFDLKEVN